MRALRSFIHQMRRGRLFRDQRGQGMTEYIIIVALVAIGTIAVVTVFGNNIRGLFALSADGLNGEKNLSTKTYTSDQAKSVKDKNLIDLGGP